MITKYIYSLLAVAISFNFLACKQVQHYQKTRQRLHHSLTKMKVAAEANDAAEADDRFEYLLGNFQLYSRDTNVAAELSQQICENLQNWINAHSGNTPTKVSREEQKQLAILNEQFNASDFAIYRQELIDLQQILVAIRTHCNNSPNSLSCENAANDLPILFDSVQAHKNYYRQIAKLLIEFKQGQ